MTRPTRSAPRFPTVPMLALLGLAALAPVADAGRGSAGPESLRSVLRAAIADRGLDPDEVVVPYALDAEMRAWVRERIPPGLPSERKLERLVEALLAPDELELRYVWGYTGTAAEVFARREANCLAFTNLFVAMARELGVPVYFLAVESEATYRHADEIDLIVVSDHVAVGYGAGNTIRLYDFSANERSELDRVYRISDLTALAMFHSNRGAEALQAGRLGEARRWLRTAVDLDPGLAGAWVNLGVARRRTGDLAGAEEAYRRVLEIDPRIYSAYQNLASLLRLAGRDEEARNLEQALKRSPSKNPYTFLALGDVSLRSGRLEEARRFYRRAASLARRDAETYAALGELAAVTGDLRTARRMLRKARRLDLDNRRTDRLARRIEGAEPGV